MMLKKSKQKSGASHKKNSIAPTIVDDHRHGEDDGAHTDEVSLSRIRSRFHTHLGMKESSTTKNPTRPTQRFDEAGPDDPNLTTPMPRYNAMLAVVRNTLYM
jgi:hypothetical protein